MKFKIVDEQDRVVAGLEDITEAHHLVTSDVAWERWPTTLEVGESTWGRARQRETYKIVRTE